MSDQTVETTISSENQSSIEEKSSIENEKKSNENETLNSTESIRPIRRSTMPQDIRYVTESNDQTKLIEKFTNYQMSDTNACNIRFLVDNRQKKILLGRNEDNTNLKSLSKIFHTNIFPGYQLSGKHSYKIFGTEMNVHRCLIEIINRIYKQSIKIEHVSEKSPPHPTSIFVTTINVDSSITEMKKTIQTNTNDEQEKSILIEQKSTISLIMLITSQGQEVLKKNWSFFGGSLQQRLNVIVANPVKLPKFGDKQVQHELSITGQSIENLADASLQIAAFINDILGVTIQPYKYDETTISNDNRRSKNENQSSLSSQQQARTFVNRNRNGNGIFEQTILIRSQFVSRIIGSRGSNLKRIQAKCHLRDMIISRQANENGYADCILTSYQARNLHFAIETIRSFLRNEDENAIIVPESNANDNQTQDSSNLHQLTSINHKEQTSKGTLELPSSSFLTKNLNPYPQPSYNFQNIPSFDFTHQATSASRKTDKRRGDLTDSNKPSTESSNSTYDNFSPTNYHSNSPKHQSKRSCPETKEINCATDDGFWIQKQFYNALDDTSKQLFDSLIEKLDQIRIANEENAARKQQRLVGRNRPNKIRTHASTIPYLTEDNNRTNENELIQNEILTKLEQSTDTSEEKENKQDTSTTVNTDN